MSEIIKISYETVSGVFAVAGFVFCIYYIFLKRKLCIRGKAYLILDTDGAGELLEYYVRRISAGIKINKIILYSSSGTPEASNICEILSRDYPNVKFCGNFINLSKLD